MEMPCVFLCVQWCLGVCTCRGVKVRGPCVSSPLIFHSIFWNRVSHGTCSSLAQLWWLPSEHQRSSCIYLLELRSPCLCPRHPGDKEPPFSSSIWRIQHLMQDKLWATNSPNHCHSLVEELYTFEGLWIISTDGEFWVVFSFITLECTTCLLLITWFLKRNPMWCYCLCLWVVCFPGGFFQDFLLVFWDLAELQKPLYLHPFTVSCALWYPFLQENCSNHLFMYLPTSTTLLYQASEIF